MNMAKQVTDISEQCSALISAMLGGHFSPVYLLMGEEPYFPDLVCSEIMSTCVDEASRDFNETVCYGADVTVEQVISAARRFPMMADRQLVVVKDAQLLKGLDELSLYCDNPLETTVLVILMRGASADKRKALYKSVSKNGTVLESPAIRDYQMASWIISYYTGRGLSIDPAAAALLAESVGTDLSRVVVETDKLLKNLPEGSTKVGVQEIERNVGVSREFSVFELTAALSAKNSAKALKIAARLGTSARFSMPPTMSAISSTFIKILKYGLLLSKGGYPSPEDKAKALAGVNPYFYREYDAAVRNYPVQKSMAIVSLLCDYDYLSKGGDGGVTQPGELLLELTAKILNI